MTDLPLKFNEQYYLFLDELRESGITNMFGAIPYLEKQFNLNKELAREVLKDWMETFEDRSSK